MVAGRAEELLLLRWSSFIFAFAIAIAAAGGSECYAFAFAFAVAVDGPYNINSSMKMK